VRRPISILLCQTDHTSRRKLRYLRPRRKLPTMPRTRLLCHGPERLDLHGVAEVGQAFDWSIERRDQRPHRRAGAPRDPERAPLIPVGDTFTFMVRGRQDRGGMGAHSLLMGTRNRRRAGGAFVGREVCTCRCRRLKRKFLNNLVTIANRSWPRQPISEGRTTVQKMYSRTNRAPFEASENSNVEYRPNPPPTRKHSQSCHGRKFVR